jgi:hypothetical protein
MLVLVALSLAAVYTWVQEAESAEHKIRRIRMYYAGQAAMVYAFEQMRTGAAVTSPVSVGDGAIGYPAGGVPATITVTAGAGPLATDRLTISVQYP